MTDLRTQIFDLIEYYQQLHRTAQGMIEGERIRNNQTTESQKRIAFFSGTVGVYEKILQDLEKLAVQIDDPAYSLLWDVYIYEPGYEVESDFPFRPVAMSLPLNVAIKEAERQAKELCPDGYYWNVHPISSRGSKNMVGQIRGKKSVHSHTDVLLRGVPHAK